MKKLKVIVFFDNLDRKFYFQCDSEDKESGNDTEHFLNVLKAWWGKTNEETEE